jgi:flavin reductase (DIM6/NTAB) family NADH-FMN oxidoreductase RutF
VKCGEISRNAVEEGSVDDERFRRLCSCFPTGLTVTTLIGIDGQPHGITINSFTSVSRDPPLVLICIDHRSQIVQHFVAGRSFAINVLSHDQHELSVRFAKNWQSRFLGVAWQPGLTGSPVLYGSAAVLECSLQQIIQAGDHLIVLGEVMDGVFTDRLPLLYLRSTYSNAAPAQASVAAQGILTFDANHANECGDSGK